MAGDEPSISAETAAGVFACLGSGHLRGGRVSRRMGGGSFPPDILSNLATRYHRAGGVISSRRFPPPWTVEETDACFIMKDHAGPSLAYVYLENEPGRRAATRLM